MFKINGLESHLKAHIRGQDHILPRLSASLERGEFGLAPEGRPKASFLFLGPTGVGKTETALAFTQFIFDKKALFRFDMSELQHEDGIKLFVGDESGQHGRLGETLLKHKTGTLLFDEIEKAHRKILDLLLQILSAAIVTTGTATTHDLSQFYIVCTSNIGGLDVMRSHALSFSSMERHVFSKLNLELRPEIVGRFSEKFVFKKLDYETQREIAQMTLNRELSRFALKGYHIQADGEVIEFLVREGIDKTLGARPMLHTVERHVGNALRIQMKNGQHPSGKLIVAPDRKSLILLPA